MIYGSSYGAYMGLVSRVSMTRQGGDRRPPFASTLGYLWRPVWNQLKLSSHLLAPHWPYFGLEHNTNKSSKGTAIEKVLTFPSSCWTAPFARSSPIVILIHTVKHMVGVSVVLLERCCSINLCEISAVFFTCCYITWRPFRQELQKETG